MKRFVIFAFRKKHPSGGWEDVVCNERGKPLSFEKKKGAMEGMYRHIEGHIDRYEYQIIDLRTGKVVAG